MSEKTLYYAQLAEDTARRLTGNWERWAGFLATASRLYKYHYPDQLMIYAQRPDATACASYDVWNDRMNRYVQQGNALGAAPDIAVHAVIPDIVGCTGDGVGPLGVDHELVGVGIFIEPC